MAEVKIKDVAKYAGVSAITITRVLRSPELVKPETRARVQDAISKLGYIPNYSAAVLRSAHSNTVGVTLFDIENPFISKLVTCLKDNLEKENYSTLVSFESEKKVNDFTLYSRLKTYNVDLSIFIPTQYDQRIESLPSAAKAKCIQLFRPQYKEMSWLAIDDEKGGYLGTKYLLENGHRRILLIDYDQRIKMNRDKGYKQAYEEMGLKADPNNILLLSEDETSPYVDLIREKIEEVKPTAVFSVTQRITTAAMSALKQLQLRFPNDVSLVAYDDSPTMQYLSVTVITHQFAKVVSSLTELALSKLKNTKPSDNVLLSPYLEVRSSVKNISES